VPQCCAASAFPNPPPTCHWRRKSRSPKPTSPHVLARSRGHIRFLGSAIATARRTSSSLNAGICGSSSTIYFIYFSPFPTPLYECLYSLFVLAFLLLLALGSLSLSQIIVLVSLVNDLLKYVSEIGLTLLNCAPIIHAAVFFPVSKLIYTPLNCYYFKQPRQRCCQSS
jgi:hypothetical protein